MPRLITRSLFAFTALAIACAPLHAQDKAPAKKRGDQTKITRADLDEAGTAVVTAYDAVRLLRSRWLQPPLGRSAPSAMTSSGMSATQPIVYVDDIRQPDIENSLTRVKVSEIVELKYLDQNRGVQEYGPGHEAGVISVTTIRKRK